MVSSAIGLPRLEVQHSNKACEAAGPAKHGDGIVQ
jgi:hypothetical protein